MFPGCRFSSMKLNKQYRCIRLILGDQLNAQHSWFGQTDEETLYVLFEQRSETDYTRHHIQKIIGFFLAMRHFAEARRAEGHHVLYWDLDEPENEQNFSDNIRKLTQRYGATQFSYQLPDEYRLDVELKALAEELPCETEVADTEHFLTTRKYIADFFEGKKRYLMESFYRQMRREYDLLMEPDGKTPLTGVWNYDQRNRNRMPKRVDIPPALHFPRDVSKIVDMLERHGVKTMGNVDKVGFLWQVTREESLQVLDHFVRYGLPEFGTYQDSLTDRHYLLFHSRLSFSMNTKMLHPLEVVHACINYWREHPEEVEIQQIEGFVRQIIGWREYMRGIYWDKMPDYEQVNYFNHTQKLPDWYWTGNTKMHCLAHAVGQSLDHAYAHHIQRLMITGNFALLLGAHPDEVDDWYLGVYMDAIQWVEITNTRGMSQFADGGLVGTKPYVSSANYINKMSDYCRDCQYDPKKRVGPTACPFNALYWDFYDRNEEQLRRIPRIGMAYRHLDKMNAEDKQALFERAAWIREHANEL